MDMIVCGGQVFLIHKDCPQRLVTVERVMYTNMGRKKRNMEIDGVLFWALITLSMKFAYEWGKACR